MIAVKDVGENKKGVFDGDIIKLKKHINTDN